MGFPSGANAARLYSFSSRARAAIAQSAKAIEAKPPGPEKRGNRTSEVLVRHLSGNPTSMIGLCQEGKSSPGALWEERGCKFFLILRRVCWPLGRGSYFG